MRSAGLSGRVVVALLMLLIALPCRSAEPTSSPAGLNPADLPLVRIGYENTSYYPWSLPDGRGVDLHLLGEVAQTCGVRVQLRTLAWEDCLRQLEQGALDGVINVSHTIEREKKYQYPTTDGQVDSALRMHIDGYGFYHRRGEPFCWHDGLSDEFRGVVAAQREFSVVDLLRARNIAVDDNFTSAEDILALMAKGEVQAAALLYTNADHLLQRNPAWASAVEKCPDDIISKPYYLVFNRSYYEHNRELCNRVWQQIAQVRSSPRYGKLIARMYADDAAADAPAPTNATPPAPTPPPTPAR